MSNAAGIRPLGRPAEHSDEGPIARGPYMPEVDDSGAPGIRQVGNPPEHASNTFTVVRSHTQNFQAFDPAPFEPAESG